MDDAWFELNRTWWDERVAAHVGSDFYGVDRFLAGGTPLRALRDRGGRRRRRARPRPPPVPLRHGHARLGAPRRPGRRRRPERAGDRSRPASWRRGPGSTPSSRWPTCTTRRPLSVVERSTASTPGIGALCWLPDIDEWARVVARAAPARRPAAPRRVPPGHPLVPQRDRPHREVLVLPRGPVGVGRRSRRAGLDYADPDATFEHNDTVEWNHGIGAIVTALAGAGLRIESLVERPTLLHAALAVQVEVGRPGLAHPARPARRSRSASASSP